jgi:Lrp/AsnC family leucine-responsive transcriptional regulator
MTEQKLDFFDRRILLAVMGNARMSNVALAKHVNLSPSQCARRLQALERRGVVRGYSAQLDLASVGLGVTAFVTVTMEKHGQAQAQAFHDAVQSVDEILECQLVTGDGDYLLRVVAPNLTAFSSLMTEQLMRLPGVANLRSSIALTPIKDSARLPIPANQE